jgi:hypothetical protein
MLVIPGLNGIARACLCQNPGPPCAVYSKAASIFVGQVSEVAEVQRDPQENFQYLGVRFSVEETFKGVVTSEKEILTVSGGTCDFGFEKGKKYLVYAFRGAPGGKLMTGICKRTQELSPRSAEDLDFLRSLSKGVPRSSIFVLALDAGIKGPRIPLEGIEIIVKGGGTRYRGVTDREGRFEITPVRPGDYQVRAIGAMYTWFSNSGRNFKTGVTGGRMFGESTEEIVRGGCAFIQFDMFIDKEREKR